MSKTNSNNSNKSNGNKGKQNRRPNKQGERGNVTNNPSAMKPMKQDKFGGISTKYSSNDPDWYFTSPELANQVSNFPFPYFLGSHSNAGTSQIPTVLVGFVNPSAGTTRDRFGQIRVGGANMAAQKLYTRLSVASGRTASYQPNDVLMSILATTEIVSLIEYARRFFGIATTYNQRNRVFAIRILGMLAGEMSTEQNPQMNSVFGQDFVTHMADYRMKLNAIITKVNQIPILADIGYVRKSISLYQKVYVDDTSETAQIYALSPESSWWLDEENETGTVLRTMQISGLETFDDLLVVINDAVDMLLNSTTLNYVYADIFNYQAKFSLNLFQLDYVLEGYSVIPEYSERFLQQIHNASAIGTPITSDQWNHLTVTKKEFTTADNDVFSDPNTGFVVYNPVFQHCTEGSIDNHYNNTKVWYDFTSSNPTLEDKVDNIMFRTSVPSRGAGHDYEDEHNCFGTCLTLPDHYITYFVMYGSYINVWLKFLNNGSELNQGIDGNNMAYIMPTTGGFEAMNHERVSVATAAFNLAPLMIKYAAAQTGQVEDPSWIFGSKTFLTSIDRAHLDIMFDLVYQGLFELR